MFKLAHKMVMQFQLTAARRRLASTRVTAHAETCFNSQPPEGGWPASCAAISRSIVSTHSRPKAAGIKAGSRDIVHKLFQLTAARRRLVKHLKNAADSIGFNSQPPEGGWIMAWRWASLNSVSTHSRPKAAG